nr:MAK10-like protein [Tanacetum cinerariifolium]
MEQSLSVYTYWKLRYTKRIKSQAEKSASALHLSVVRRTSSQNMSKCRRILDIIENLSLYDHEGWNDSKEFIKLVKAISLPQDVPSTSDCRLIELENQVQCLMKAHLATMQPTQVNKNTTSCEICSGSHDTQYCMEDLEQAFVEYASSRTDEAGGALPNDTVKNPKLNINSTTSVLFSRSYPTEDPQCSTDIHGSINTITIHPKQQSDSHEDKSKENKEEEKINQEDINTNSSMPPDPSVSFITKKVLKLNSFFESLSLAP